jgi:hypothetical protein
MTDLFGIIPAPLSCRCRGLAYRHLGRWEAALKDIANAQVMIFRAHEFTDETTDH